MTVLISATGLTVGLRIGLWPRVSEPAVADIVSLDTFYLVGFGLLSAPSIGSSRLMKKRSLNPAQKAATKYAAEGLPMAPTCKIPHNCTKKMMSPAAAPMIGRSMIDSRST